METQRAQRCRAGGHDLEFVRIPARRPDAPELVFLHEGLGSVQLWRGFPAALAAATGCGALVYSRYGNGFSDVLEEPRRPGYMHDEARVVLPELLTVLAIREAVLVGHSDGASIAIVFASEHPDVVRGLVLEAPHVFVEELSVRSIAAIRTAYESQGLRERMARRHRDADRTFYGWNDIWLAPEFRAWNIEEHASRIAAPALLVQGVDDEYGSTAQLDAIAGPATVRVDRALLGACGHAPHRDRPAIVEAIATAWIDELTAA
jgi:pimeloyl-ACP methyl ester carboxylesterase